VVTPVALTDAIPLLNTDGSGRNNSRDIRTGLLTALVLPTSSEYVARQGVLPRRWDGAAWRSLKVYPNGTANRTVLIAGGACVITRTGEGAYLVHTTTDVNAVEADPAPATNPVVEAVVVRLWDKRISADTGAALHGPYFDIIAGIPGSPLNLNGTPGTAGAPPALPDGVLLLAYLSRDAGSAGDTISAAKITDMRTSTAPLGSARLMLPGDSASAAGTLPGELRMRTVNGVVLPPEVWGADSQWHGTVPLVYTTSPAHANLPVPSTFATLSIPDPGWPYRLIVEGKFQLNDIGTANAAYMKVRTGTALSGPIVGASWAGKVTSQSAFTHPFGYFHAADPAGTARTGAVTVHGSMEGPTSGNVGVFASAANEFTTMTVTIVPV
jgi:hypothetical protein